VVPSAAHADSHVTFIITIYINKKKQKEKKEVGRDQLEKASATLGTSAPIKILKILKGFARFHFREFSEMLVMLWRSLFH